MTKAHSHGTLSKISRCASRNFDQHQKHKEPVNPMEEKACSAKSTVMLKLLVSFYG